MHCGHFWGKNRKINTEWKAPSPPTLEGTPGRTLVPTAREAPRQILGGKYEPQYGALPLGVRGGQVARCCPLSTPPSALTYCGMPASRVWVQNQRPTAGCRWRGGVRVWSLLSRNWNEPNHVRVSLDPPCGAAAFLPRWALASHWPREVDEFFPPSTLGVYSPTHNLPPKKKVTDVWRDHWLYAKMVAWQEANLQKGSKNCQGADFLTRA